MPDPSDRSESPALQRAYQLLGQVEQEIDANDAATDADRKQLLEREQEIQQLLTRAEQAGQADPKLQEELDELQRTYRAITDPEDET